MKYIRKLSGTRCYLSPMCLDDYALYTEWLNDLETTQYLTLSTANITLENEKECLRRLSREHNYAIVDQKEDMLIGNCGLVQWDQIQATAEIGIFIGHPDYRDKGYGSEAMTLLLKYAFDYLNIKSVFLKVFGFNHRAVRCYEKVGFKMIGRWRSAVEQHGARHDILLMDCLPEDLNRQ